MDFKKYAQTGEAFLKKLAIELGNPKDTARAGRVLRGVLHVFRDQSSPQESLQLISQLPMFIKAVYVDGWKINHQKKRIRKLDEFIFAIQERTGVTKGFDYIDEEDVMKAVKATFKVIKQYVSAGEIDDLIITLPKELRPLLEEV